MSIVYAAIETCIDCDAITVWMQWTKTEKTKTEKSARN